jgi:aminoglycoside/choline kinase family phosphotransferase
MAPLLFEPAMMDPRIQAYLDEPRLFDGVQQVVALTGDASDRRYFRVHFADRPSIVLALHAGPIDVATLPFVLIAQLMRNIPLPVPGIFHGSNELGVLCLEDLGDVTLQAHLGVASRAEHAALYRQAVDFIAILQQRGAALASPECPAYAVAFDVEKLTWELEFFVKHYLMTYRSLPLSPPTREALMAEWADIAGELAAEPRVLCHRDFHSRNLMLHDGSLYIIDFQDARMGPDTYDLASLLRDSYVDLTPAQVDELIAYFLALTRDPAARHGEDAAAFRRRFDLMALQRNLKALGTFGYQTTTRGNPVYIQYMPRTLSYVKGTLARYPRFGRLHDVLAEHVPELR